MIRINYPIRPETLGEEAIGVTLPPSENCELLLLSQFDGTSVWVA